MSKDYSEYQLEEYEKKSILRHGNKNISFDYFCNNVWYGKDNKYFIITVDESKELYYMQELINDIEGEPDDTLFDEDDYKSKQDLYEYFCNKYNVVREKDFEQDAPLYNVLSGSMIKFNIGEGILDFLYADFDTPFEKEYSFFKALSVMGERYRKENDVEIKEASPTKIHNHTEEIVQEFYDYTSTIVYAESVAKQSLYTAICPPVFREQADDKLKSLVWYYNYLKQLQQEYKDLIEFCFDDEYYPDVLGNLLPSERYRAYCSLNNISSSATRKETFTMSVSKRQGKNMPFGMTTEQLCERFADRPKVTEQHKELAEKFNMNAEALAYRVTMPSFININYEVSSVMEMLELEFTKMLELNIRFRKCKRCGRYFIMKGNYDTNYCDRIAEGETKNCQDIMAMENYKKKMADNAAITIYNKYYKRYFARVKAHTILEDDFKKWKYEAIVKRDQCSDGKITNEEFTAWLDSCFPNRKRKH